MVQLVSIGKGMTQSAVAGGAPKIQPIVYEAESTTYFNALTASGLTLTNARKYTINRAMQRLKAAGLHTKISIGFAFSSNAFAIDMCGLITPTKVGTLTFANDGITVSSNASYLDFGIQMKDVNPTDHSMFYLGRSGSAGSSAWEMGAYDGTSLRIAFNARNTSNLFQAGSNCAAVTLGTTSQVSGTDFNGISRHPATPGTFYNYVRGIMRASSTTAATTTSSTNTLRLFVPGGLTTFSTRSIAAWALGKGLTHDEVCTLYAIMKSVDNMFHYGEPDIQDAGYGDAVVGVDVVVVGLSPAGIYAGYQAMRAGRTVAFIGGERDTSHEHIGWLPVAWVDADDYTTVNGIMRALLTQCNASLSLSDTSDQQGLSHHTMRYNRICRAMLDTTRSSGTLPGLGGKVYFASGTPVATMATTAIGLECVKLTTPDGRVFQPAGSRMIVVNGEYDCNIAPALGVSYIRGREARGSAPGENLNGYDPTALFPLRDSAGNTYNSISSYVVDGNAGSGLLPLVIDLPSITSGDPDPTTQAMCYRIHATSSVSRAAPLTGGYQIAPSPDYNALSFEPLMRLYAAITAAGRTPSINDAYTTGHCIEGAASLVEDWNNGASGYSIDMGQLAGEYLAANTRAERLAKIQKLTNFTIDFAYHHLASGDSRIPTSLKNAIAAYGLDTAWGVDPFPGHPLFFPPHPYWRDARNQPKNTFNFSANDTFATDGTTPRSIKTIATASYRADQHTTRWVNISGFIQRQGGVNDSSAGGTNERTPIPLEAVVPDKAECANFISPAALFITKMGNASCRMEPVFQMCGQAAGLIADHALTEGVAVQDVDYPSLRTALLAIPDASKPALPQVN